MDLLLDGFRARLLASYTQGAQRVNPFGPSGRRISNL